MSERKNKKEKSSFLKHNIFLLSISSLGHKILAFIFIPFYTSFLTTSQYGYIDLINTTVSLILPIFSLNIAEAILRFTIKDKNNNSYLLYGIKIFGRGLLLLLLILVILRFLPCSYINTGYFRLIVLLYLSNGIYNILQSFLRAINKVEIMVEGSIINSIVLLTGNVLLIAKLRLGVNGYFISLICALFLSSLYMGIKSNFYSHIQSGYLKNKELETECLKYAIPTIFTALAWWINSSLDRYFVTVMCGVRENGIYSMAYKIPTILGLFQMIFSQAWTLSAVDDFDREDSDGFFGDIYSLYNTCMVIATSGLIISNVFLSKMLYIDDFFSAWKYVPFLLVSSLFSALSGYMGGIFSAVKDTKTLAISTMISAIVNVVLNFILIKPLGGMGAAIATVLSYILSWAIRLVTSRKYIKLKTNIKVDIVVYFLLFIQTLVAMSNNHLYFIQGVILVCICTLYKEYIKKLFIKLLKRIN